MTSEVDQAAQTDVEEVRTRQATLLFVRMWAVAHVLHLVIANRAALDTPWNVTVVALALAVLITPARGRVFATMLVAQLVEFVADMPLSPDHWALVSLVNIALLTMMAIERSTSVSTVQRAFPAARVILLVAYGAAALSKWNTAFLDPVTSCANAIAQVVTYGLVSPLTESPVLNVGAAVTEALVVCLLVIPSTRSWGVLLGLAFHLSLSASPMMVVGDFTSTVYALFFLFLRPQVIAAILGRVTFWAGKSRIVKDARRRPEVTASLAFLVLGLGGHAYLAVPMALLYVLVQCYFIGLLLATGLTLRRVRGSARIGRIGLLHVPVLLLAVAWALNPYLGLRTTGSFTMFSNLQTESPHPNHLFMPSWRLTSWQDDMVLLTSSTDDQLSAGAANELAIPLVALRRMAMDDASIEVTGTLDGVETTWGPGPDQEHLVPLEWWQYKLVLMRPVTTDGRPFCSQS